MAKAHLKRVVNGAVRAVRRWVIGSAGSPPASARPDSAGEDAVRKIVKSGLIDLDYYNRQIESELPDLASAARHYLVSGAATRINPNSSFDSIWYLEKHQEPGETLNPLLDYIDNAEKKHRNPSAAFDRAFYLSIHRDVAAAGIDPLRHFIEHGQSENRITSPLGGDEKIAALSDALDTLSSDGSSPQYGDDVRKIIDSGLLDLYYYNLQLESDLPDLLSAAQHYLTIGAETGINPNSAFDSAWYIDTYRESGEEINPLIDYIDNAEKKNRNPSSAFDRLFYLSFHRDVAAAGIEPLRHFIQHGQSEKRVTSPFVDNERTPTRFRGLFSEVLPQDGVITFEGNFAVKPIKDSTAEMLISTYPPARDEHPNAAIHNSPIARAYPTAPYVAHFRNVAMVGGTRLILPDSQTALSDEIHAFKAQPESSIRPHSFLLDGSGKLRTTLSRKYPSRLKRGIHCMHEYAGNYFHFVVEVLPRLFIADRMELSHDLPLLIQSGLAKNLRVLLDCMNVNGREIIELTERQIFQVEDLYLVSDASSIQDVYSREREPAETVLHLGLLRDMVSTILEQYSTSDVAERQPRRRRIYVRRGQRYRGLRNESEVEDFLVEQGFELVSTDDLSVRSQINIFREAELVLCPTGAAVTNILWCRPGTEVHVFMSDHVATPTEIWTQLGSVSGCSVSVTKCERAFSSDGKYAMHDDYYVDINAIRKIVDGFKGRSGAH